MALFATITGFARQQPEWVIAALLDAGVAFPVKVPVFVNPEYPSQVFVRLATDRILKANRFTYDRVTRIQRPHVPAVPRSHLYWDSCQSLM